jgi:hypothetical protein
MPISSRETSSSDTAAGDLILFMLRRALVLVGVARTADDAASAARAEQEARTLLRTVRQMYSVASLKDAQDARVQRGIEFLTRSLQAGERA